jgi:hypothetical protein
VLTSVIIEIAFWCHLKTEGLQPTLVTSSGRIKRERERGGRERERERRREKAVKSL